MASEGFQFKQFFVAHDRCAMKVGTDGVLLGAWAEPNHVPSDHLPCTILDVGTGSGLIALMLAQRLHTSPLPSPKEREKGFRIDAIDIDEAAVEQAADNFRSSPWSEHLHAFHARLQDWQSRSVPSLEGEGMVREGFYSLIVSNPPYFRNSLKNPDKARELARHTDTLSYTELLHHSARLLREEGRLCLILPAETENEVCALAAQEGFVLTRVTRVYSKVSKPARRVLLAFEKSELSTIHTASADRSRLCRDKNSQLSTINSLVLEDDQGGRSAAYREITKDFYL